MLFLPFTILLVIEAQDSTPICPTEFSDTITCYFDTTIRVYTYNLFSPDEVSVEKDVSNGDMVILSTTPGTDFIDFSVYFTAAGPFSIKVNCKENSESFTLTIADPILQLTTVPSVIDIQTLHTGTRFKLIGTIMDPSSRVPSVPIDSFFCSWTITQYHSSAYSYIEGPTSTVSSNNQCIFEGMRITVSGTYQLTVSAWPSRAISNSLTLRLNSKAPNMMSISMSTYEPTVYFEFYVTVRVYSDAATLYYENININISEDSGSAILGATTGRTSTGSFTFLVYFNTLGSKTITASASANYYDYNNLVTPAKSRVVVQSEIIKATLSLIVIEN